MPAPVALPARPVTVVLVVVVVPVVVVQVLCQLDLSQSGAASLCSATLACPTHWSSAAQGIHSLVIIAGNNVHAPLDLVLCGEGDITGAISMDSVLALDFWVVEEEREE